MRRALKTLAVVVLVTLMPLRAVAAVTAGFCVTGHDHAAIAAQADHDHGALSHGHHGGDESPAKSSAPSCSSCVEHCSGAAFATSTDPALGASAIAQDRISFAARIAPAFLTDQLDRPPLA